MRPFEKFALSQPGEVPASVRQNYKLPGNPWGSGVAEFHLMKLPLLACNGASAVPCAYCQDPVTRFNTEIDHLVPVRTYARYKAYSAGAKSDSEIDLVMRAANSERSNLVIACVPCNQSKKTKTSIDDLQAQGKQFVEFMKNAGVASKVGQKFVTAINVLGVIAGHAHAREICMDVATRGQRAQGYSDQVIAIQSNSVRLFTRSRPAFTFQWQDLAHEQGFVLYNMEGRACPYCLGIYASGFELDHIRPKAHTQAMNVTQNYNNPLNLVAVCASCNSAKGTYSVSRSLLDERIKARQEAGIPGCELFDDSDKLADTRADQDRIFDL